MRLLLKLLRFLLNFVDIPKGTENVFEVIQQNQLVSALRSGMQSSRAVLGVDIPPVKTTNVEQFPAA